MAAAHNVTILKWREKLVLVYAARWRLCEKMVGNSLRWWEIGLAQTQDGGCVKEQMADPQSQDGCRAQCNNIKMTGKVSASLCRKMAVV
jgi:hypothetical protein